MKKSEIPFSFSMWLLSLSQLLVSSNICMMTQSKITLILESFLETSGDINIFKMVTFLCKQNKTKTNPKTKEKKKNPKNFLKKSHCSIDR